MLFSASQSHGSRRLNLCEIIFHDNSPLSYWNPVPIHDAIRPLELPIHDSIRPSELPIHDSIRTTDTR